MVKWIKGRQNSGYDKLLILTGMKPLPFDIYLLRFKKGSFVESHVDEVKTGKHFRLNIILKNAKEGGLLYSEGWILDRKRIKLFRPDIFAHGLSEVEEGTMYILSIGWVCKF